MDTKRPVSNGRVTLVQNCLPYILNVLAVASTLKL